MENHLLYKLTEPGKCCTFQVWETGVASPLESPRAITDDLPSFSLSPLPYITEVFVASIPLCW